VIYSVTINNKAIADNGLELTLQQAYLLTGLHSIVANWEGVSRLNYMGSDYYWLSYSMVIEELPMLKVKHKGILKYIEKDTLYGLFKELANDGFLIAHPDNQRQGRTYYAFAPKLYLLLGKNLKSAPPTEINPYPYGNKSVPTETNPYPYGNKSVPPTEINPYNNNTKDNSTKDNKEEEITIVIPSSENNPNGLFPTGKNSVSENQNQKNQAPQASPTQTPPADKKEKSCAKKEKAPMKRTAITAEFERRGLRLFLLVREQPSDAWYQENVGRYGSANFWAIFKKMHDHCENKGREYAKLASGFSDWAISADGLAAYEALQGYWRDRTGKSWTELADLLKSDKNALQGIGEKLKKDMEESGVIQPLASYARSFFDQLPERWARHNPQYGHFKLSDIDSSMPQVLGAIAEGANPQQQQAQATGGRMSAAEKRMNTLNGFLTEKTKQDLIGFTRDMLQRGEHSRQTFDMIPAIYEELCAECGVIVPIEFYHHQPQ